MGLRTASPDKVMSAKKRKRETKLIVESNYTKPPTDNSPPKKLKNKTITTIKSAPPVLQKKPNVKPRLDNVVNVDTKKHTAGITEDIGKRYPVLENKDLVQKFLSVPMTNNQKGRIRQLLKDSLKGTSEFLLPDVIHTRIQSILKSSNKDGLSEIELRKIRILYNMLKTALATETAAVDGLKKKNKKPNSKKPETDNKEIIAIKKEEKINKEVKTEEGDVKETTKTVDSKKVESGSEKPKVVKPKGPKRYVVFVGNLPPNIDKEKIMQHFSEFNECIVNIRIPKRPEDNKSSIAYVELKNEPTYELALSKHHSMLGSKRINVLYTTQKNGKVTKTEAKSKSAKLIALQKAGKLIGSVPVNRKRSHRRMKMKRAQAKLNAESA